MPSAAVLHSNGDGLDIAVKDGRIVGVRGRSVDRVNHGHPRADRLSADPDERHTAAPCGPTPLLLADLRRIHRIAAGASAKDLELLELTSRCHPQTLRQMRWANAMLKELPPQALTS